MRCSLASVAACCGVCRAPAVHLPCIRLRSLVLTLTTEESPPHRTIVHERRLSPNGLSVTAARCVIRIYTQKIKGLEFFFAIWQKHLVVFCIYFVICAAHVLMCAFCGTRDAAPAGGRARATRGSLVGVCACPSVSCAQRNINKPPGQTQSQSFITLKGLAIYRYLPPRRPSRNRISWSHDSGEIN